MNTLYIDFIILFILCVVASAFFAVTEIAFISLQRIKLERMLETHVEGATEVAALVKRPERILSMVLLGNNFVNTAAAALGTYLALEAFGTSGTLYATLFVTIILLIFGDTIPKTMAAHHAEALAVKLVKPVKILFWIFRPVIAFLSWIAMGFGKLVGAHTMGGSLVSEEEIRTMINVGQRDGAVGEAEAQMLHKVFEFGDRPAREIMVPRTEVIWTHKGTPITDFFKLYMEHPLNRYPVVQGTRDNVVGIVSSKDILMNLAQGTCDINRTIDDVTRPAHFAPESKRISEILAEMRDQKYHMCIIVDEYGGTAGIVTMTQLVEEIIGDVKDELSKVEKDFEVINEYTFQVDGLMRIEDANKEMGLGLPEGDYDTVAGFMLKTLSHIPKVGEQIKYKDLKMTVTRMDGLKIEEILVTKEKYATTTDKV